MSVFVKDASNRRVIARGEVRGKTLERWMRDLQDDISLDDVASTFTSGDATPSVLDNSKFITAGSTTITNFDDGVEGQTIFIYRGASDITIAENATIDTALGVNLTLSTARPSAAFRLASGVWKQIDETGVMATTFLPVAQAASLAASRTAFALGSADAVTFGTLTVGANPVVDGFSPGGLFASVTGTSTATSGTLYGTQKVLTVNPAGASTGDFRTDYNRVIADGGANNITKVVVGSDYLYYEGTATLATGFGGNSQVINNDTGTITSGIGDVNYVRQESAGGTFTRGVATSSIATNIGRTAGVAFTAASGAYGAVDNTVAGTITDGRAVEADIINSGAGTITSSRGVSSLTSNTGGGTITTAYGLTARLANTSGTVTNYYGVYIFTNTGTAPTTNDYALYSENTSSSYFAGSLGIGDTTPTEAKLVVDTTAAYAAVFRRTDNGAAGPLVAITHNSASPAANDVWALEFKGKDSGANDEIYSYLQNRIVDPTSGSEDAQFEIYTVVAGTLARRAMVGDGLMVGTGAIDVGAGYAGVENGVHAWQNTAIPAGGTTGTGYRFSSSSNFGVFFGSGAPSLTAAKGSLYLRSDGSSTSTRAYINTDGGTTWTAITTAA